MIPAADRIHFITEARKNHKLRLVLGDYHLDNAHDHVLKSRTTVDMNIFEAIYFF